jgi:succinylglutamate desuccinylase
MGTVGLQRVIRALEGRKTLLKGTFFALAGNLAALERGCRFLDHDLNRIWSQENVDALRVDAISDSLANDRKEQYELLTLIEEILEGDFSQIYFLDLHTTSADGGPFAIFGDSLQNRQFAEHLPVSLILGLEEQIHGSLLEWFGELGAVTLGFEAGQHDAPESAALHEAAVWIALVASGVLSAGACPEPSEALARLSERAKGLPRVVEVLHRQEVHPSDNFRMEPGYRNFHAVRRNQVLAKDKNGEIRSPLSGRVLLPLYQTQGNDGFFLVQDISRFWLGLSAFLRSTALTSLVPCLPGVRRHPELGQTVVVNRHVARWLVVRLFHLLGYRKRREDEGHFVFTQRDRG